MIIGKGQLASILESLDASDTINFASGVADSNCEDPKQFEREKNLLIKTLNTNENKKFVYFSSCALSADDYKKNAYYKHKQNMENIIKEKSREYYIFRIPQLFGELKHHKTLINFLYFSILDEKKFTLYPNAYRYVIEISDLKKIVELYINQVPPKIVVDIANPYRYNVKEIVQTLETLLGKQATYTEKLKFDGYELDLPFLEELKKMNFNDINFGKDYLYEKLKEKIKC
jgi:nucleoside-diphosphate-sugar epimerase